MTKGKRAGKINGTWDLATLCQRVMGAVALSLRSFDSKSNRTVIIFDR